MARTFEMPLHSRNRILQLDLILDHLRNLLGSLLRRNYDVSVRNDGGRVPLFEAVEGVEKVLRRCSLNFFR